MTCNIVIVHIFCIRNTFDNVTAYSECFVSNHLREMAYISSWLWTLIVAIWQNPFNTRQSFILNKSFPNNTFNERFKRIICWRPTIHSKILGKELIKHGSTAMTMLNFTLNGICKCNPFKFILLNLTVWKWIRAWTFDKELALNDLIKILKFHSQWSPFWLLFCCFATKNDIDFTMCK